MEIFGKSSGKTCKTQEILFSKSMRTGSNLTWISNNTRPNIIKTYPSIINFPLSDSEDADPQFIFFPHSIEDRIITTQQPNQFNGQSNHLSILSHLFSSSRFNRRKHPCCGDTTSKAMTEDRPLPSPSFPAKVNVPPPTPPLPDNETGNQKLLLLPLSSSQVETVQFWSPPLHSTDPTKMVVLATERQIHHLGSRQTVASARRKCSGRRHTDQWLFNKEDEIDLREKLLKIKKYISTMWNSPPGTTVSGLSRQTTRRRMRRNLWSHLLR